MRALVALLLTLLLVALVSACDPTGADGALAGRADIESSGALGEVRSVGRFQTGGIPA